MAVSVHGKHDEADHATAIMSDRSGEAAPRRRPGPDRPQWAAFGARLDSARPYADAPHRQAAFLAAVAVDQFVARRAAIDVIFGSVEKFRLDQQTIARGGRTLDDRSDTRLVAGENSTQMQVMIVASVSAATEPTQHSALCQPLG